MKVHLLDQQGIDSHICQLEEWEMNLLAFEAYVPSQSSDWGRSGAAARRRFDLGTSVRRVARMRNCET